MHELGRGEVEVDEAVGLAGVAGLLDLHARLPQSRRVRSARPGTTGTFRIANLPPGEYYLCALTDLDSSQISSASSTFLEALAAASFKISLAEGQKLTQDVQVKR